MAAPAWAAVSIALAAWLALERLRWPLPAVLAVAAATGLLLGLLQQ